jgi:hypothetical protein
MKDKGEVKKMSTALQFHRLFGRYRGVAHELDASQNVGSRSQRESGREDSPCLSLSPLLCDVHWLFFLMGRG